MQLLGIIPIPGSLENKKDVKRINEEFTSLVILRPLALPRDILGPDSIQPTNVVSYDLYGFEGRSHCRELTSVLRPLQEKSLFIFTLIKILCWHILN